MQLKLNDIYKKLHPEKERCIFFFWIELTISFASQPLLNGDLGGSALLGLDRDAADNQPDGEEQQQSGSHLDINDADDRMKRYYGNFDLHLYSTHLLLYHYCKLLLLLLLSSL